ncbi:DDE_3 domain-containing protein [Trichonephila clavipes]|nr:DDE_3 domain-containing protein [Trichonephila clavipes]
MDQWTTVLFTVESWFSITSDSHQTFIWKEPRAHTICAQSPRNHPLRQRRLDALARILSLVGWLHTSPCFRKRHCNYLGSDFILIDNNGKAYRAPRVDEFLESEDIHCMDWLVRSPDLIPVKQAWDALGIQLQLTILSEFHSRPKNKVAERVGLQKLLNSLISGEYTCTRPVYL